MRDIKTLLEVLLDQYKNNRIDGIQRFGICWAITRLTMTDIISVQENGILTECIFSNKPGYAWGGYWWTKGDVPLRIKFLKQLISKLKKEHGHIN